MYKHIKREQNDKMSGIYHLASETHQLGAILLFFFFYLHLGKFQILFYFSCEFL